MYEEMKSLLEFLEKSEKNYDLNKIINDEF